MKNTFVNDFLRRFGNAKTITLLVMLICFAMFEMFNYSTTEFALKDVMGEISFMHIAWATILSIAFCGIDLAGLARLFTPETGRDEPAEIWYLFGAWILAAAMNASLTWWGVSIVVVKHASVGASLMGAAMIQNVVPIFVAVLVWLIRLMLIAMLSSFADKMLHGSSARVHTTPYKQPQTNFHPNNYPQQPKPQQVPMFNAGQRPRPIEVPRSMRPEPRQDVSYASLREHVDANNKRIQDNL